MTHRLVRKHHPLTLAVALALGAGSVHAANITVTDGGDAGTASTCTLRQALGSANNDDATGSTCVAGNGADAIDFDSSLAGATITLGGSELTIYGSSVTLNGSGQTIDGNGASGDLFVYNATADISNLTFIGGNTSYSGGGIASRNSHLTLTQSTVSGNTATGRGGGIASYVYRGGSNVNGRRQAAVAHRTVPGNATNGTSGVPVSGSITLVGSTVSGNTASSMAGGVVCYTSSPCTITDSTISGNQLNAGYNYGAGGVYITKYSVGTISGSTIANNTAVGGSNYGFLTGGVYQYASSLTMTNATVAGNSATGVGYLAGGLSNAYNSADSGAGYGLIMNNVTVSGNSAASGASPSAGGLFIGAFSSGGATLSNAIISGNSGPSDNDLYVYSGSASAAGSLLGSTLSGSYAGNGNVFSDSPGLGALANNGGPTMTMALMTGSPAIDAGDNSLVPGGVQYDQRGAGFPRIQNTTVDIGSFEVAAAGPGPGGGFAYVAVPSTSLWSKALLALLSTLAAGFGLFRKRRQAGNL